MVSTFINPVVKASIKIGTQSFDETAPIQVRSTPSAETAEIAIRAVYKQVLGNAHVMESERLTVAESQFKQGNLTVREFVRQVAKSEIYRTRFFEPCSRNRLIELNFKHLLGRAPQGSQDIAEHSNILETAGFDADIDAYVDSAEYDQAFGDDTVPYYRGHKTQAGKNVAGFTHLLQLLRGPSSSDKDVTQQQRARLTSTMLRNTASPILQLSGPSDSQPTDVKALLANIFGFKQEKPSVSASSITSQVSSASELAQKRYQEAYQTFRQTDPVELRANATPTEIEIVINAIYRQVLGNAYVMESERLVVSESQLRHQAISVREFVRQLAKSDLYRSRFFENCYWYRTIELNFKHLLGRAPQTFEEMKAHSALLNQAGYDADIDSYLDSDEYQDNFGENLVPFYRGYQTQPGQTLLGFTNMLQLLQSASSSDKDLTGGNKPRVQKAVIQQAPYNLTKLTDVQSIITAALQSTVSSMPAVSEVSPSLAEQEMQKQVDEQTTLISQLQSQLSELRSLSAIGAAIVRKGQLPTTGETVSGLPTTSVGFVTNPLQQTLNEQTALIDQLQADINAARPLANLAEASLNKWRRRAYR